MANPELATDVVKGLKATPKYLKSKYFYDKRGDELFQKIMKLPEYYLTTCELEILDRNKENILNIIKPEEKFQLLDLGAGDATKTKLLLRYFVNQKAIFTYCPVDISTNAIQELSMSLEKEIPHLVVNGISNEYLQAIEQIPSSPRKIILFLGSSIGNFTHDESLKFLQEVNLRMKPNDLFIIGFDLKKDPEIILEAYNDKKGVTKEFNLNLLRRINRELGAKIELDSFEHAPYYDPDSGEAVSRLISTKDQLLEIPPLELSIPIRSGEPIYTEISKKFGLSEIHELAANSGFEVIADLMDHRQYFTDSIWKKKL